MKASELKRGMVIREGKEFYAVIEVEHRTPGNLRAIYQTVLKNIVSGKMLNMRYSPSDSVEKADLESKKVQYLYHDSSGFNFMDMSSYESISLGDDLIGSERNFLKESLEVDILYFEHKPVTVELPVSVDLKIIESAPGTRGDTSGKAMKPAKLETGLTVNVPLFIKEGEVVRVDTRTSEYLGRT